jgi:hypothetical protein
MSLNRRDVRCAFFVRRSRCGGTNLGVQNSSFDDRETGPNQMVLALMARNCALQNCMSLIPKTKEVLREG